MSGSGSAGTLTTRDRSGANTIGTRFRRLLVSAVAQPGDSGLRDAPAHLFWCHPPVNWLNAPGSLERLVRGRSARNADQQSDIPLLTLQKISFFAYPMQAELDVTSGFHTSPGWRSRPWVDVAAQPSSNLVSGRVEPASSLRLRWPVEPQPRPAVASGDDYTSRSLLSMSRDSTGKETTGTDDSTLSHSSRRVW